MFKSVMFLQTVFVPVDLSHQIVYAKIYDNVGSNK